MALGSAKPAFRCESCDQRKSGRSTLSVTSRRLCAGCSDQLAATAAAMMVNSENPVGQAIATTGWLAALRAHRRARQGD